MSFIHIRPNWQLPEKLATPESAYFNRRRFLKNLAGVGLGIAAASCTGRPLTGEGKDELISTLGDPLNNFTPNPAFADAGYPITNQLFASRYNNFYEFGLTKNIWADAQKLHNDTWKL